MIRQRGCRAAALPNGLIGGAVHLPLADHVHGLDTCDQDSGAPKRLEPERRSSDSFDGPVILLHDIVQVFVLAHNEVDTDVSLDTFDGQRVDAVPADGNFLGYACRLMVRSPNRRAAALSRQVVNRKSTVSPVQSTAR